MKTVHRLLIILFFTIWSTQAQDVQSCDSKIYCQGKLLDTIQRARPYEDSKTFVDLVLINSPEETLSKFSELMQQTSDNPSTSDLQEFVQQNFNENDELQNWSPPDFTSDPQFLNGIKNLTLRAFAKNLVEIWPTLARRVKDTVASEPEKHSLIPLPNGFIIPGGRFREIYYWDTYWIVKGLLLSDMKETVRGILENFISLVKKYGFVPNGSRVYYLNRSQPPMLTLMVAEYLKSTNNQKWLAENIDILETELNYWIQQKSVTFTKSGVSYTMAHYISKSNTPRPESYYEDVKTCSFYSDESKMKECYSELKTGAETGWDFSSRWFFDENGGNNANISYIQTKRVVPVDLNAILCKCFLELSNFYKKLGKSDKQRKWYKLHLQWLNAIDNVLYNRQDGIWYDLDVQTLTQRKYFYPSNFAPLWTKSYNYLKSKVIGNRAAAYLKRNNILSYQGGIPTSIIENGEQWDAPNAWPPLQDFVITGLERTKSREAKKLAKILADRWIRANYVGYSQTKEMFEKYDANNVGQFGGGGEYTVQAGFGWTNGVVLYLINTYYGIPEL